MVKKASNQGTEKMNGPEKITQIIVSFVKDRPFFAIVQ